MLIFWGGELKWIGISAVDVRNTLLFKSMLHFNFCRRSVPIRPLYLGSKSNIKNLCVISLLNAGGKGMYTTLSCTDELCAVLIWKGSVSTQYSNMVPAITSVAIVEWLAPVSNRNLPPNSGSIMYGKYFLVWKFMDTKSGCLGWCPKENPGYYLPLARRWCR